MSFLLLSACRDRSEEQARAQKEEAEAQEILNRKLKTQAKKQEQKQEKQKMAEAAKAMATGVQQAPSDASKIEIDLDQTKALAEKIDLKTGNSKFKVLKVGKEPRKRLSYRLSPKSQWPFTLKYKLAFGLQGDLFAHPGFDLPEETIKGVFNVSSVSRLGEITCNVVFEDAPIINMVQEAGQDPRQEIVKIRVTVEMVVSAQGQVLDRVMKVSQEVPPYEKKKIFGLLEAATAVFVALPYKPVGQGAEWLEESPVKNETYNMVQISHWKLDKLDGDNLSLTLVSARKSKDNLMRAIVDGKENLAKFDSFQVGVEGSYLS
jgi:hypothetical protein